jgi:hypothetical protein
MPEHELEARLRDLYERAQGGKDADFWCSIGALTTELNGEFPANSMSSLYEALFLPTVNETEAAYRSFEETLAPDPDCMRTLECYASHSRWERRGGKAVKIFATHGDASNQVYGVARSTQVCR